MTSIITITCQNSTVVCSNDVNQISALHGHDSDDY